MATRRKTATLPLRCSKTDGPRPPLPEANQRRSHNKNQRRRATKQNNIHNTFLTAAVHIAPARTCQEGNPTRRCRSKTQTYWRRRSSRTCCALNDAAEGQSVPASKDCRSSCGQLVETGRSIKQRTDRMCLIIARWSTKQGCGLGFCRPFEMC